MAIVPFYSDGRFIQEGMRGDWDDLHYVIEVVYEPHKRAWIAYNPPPHERDSLTFEIERAQIHTEAGSRNELSRLKCGYPEWICFRKALTEKYRVEIAKYLFPQLEK